MAVDLAYLPTLVQDMAARYGDALRLALVSDLEAEDAIFVQDGNHGEYRPRKEEFVSVGVPFVRPPNLEHGRIDFSKCDRINEVAFERVRKGIGQGGDIILTNNATIGRMAITKPTDPVFVANPQTTVYRSTSPEHLDQRFLYYFMLSDGFQQQLMTHTGRNATFDYVSLTKQRSLVIPIPPLPEQRAIASILGALDDKIELNRRMNATLESLARAIFKSWFVDFDPVRAKMEGRDSTFELSPSTLSLFPDSFQNCELGKIPTGWNLERFDNHVTVDRGLSYKGAGLSDAGMPMHNLNSILEGGGYKHTGIKFYTGEYKDRHLVVPGDLIVTNTEQGFDHLLIGHAAIVPERFGDEGIFSHHIYRVRLLNESPLSPHYLVHLINWPRWHKWIAGFSNGTTINMLPKDSLEKPLLVVPPKELVDRFTELAHSIAQRFEATITQNLKLSALRDTLLPKLLSGELPVPAALTATEEAIASHRKTTSLLATFRSE